MNSIPQVYLNPISPNNPAASASNQQLLPCKMKDRSTKATERTDDPPPLRCGMQRLFIFVAIFLLQNFYISSKLLLSNAPVSSTSYALPSVFELLPKFTPDEFQAGRHDKYVNLPNTPIDPERDREVTELMERHVPKPTEILMHEASTPTSNNAILGLASYPRFMTGWRKLVGSLRLNGYDGQIIVGVNPEIPPEEQAYLDRMGVTYYAVESANCTDQEASKTGNTVRAKCSRGLEDLKLEWGRFEMARRWLKACKSCTGGWAMVIDTRDIFFQADPFASLGDPSKAKHDLLFVEEVAKYTNPIPESPDRADNLGESWRYRSHVNPCYGAENVNSNELMDRPILCSGTVIGTSDGMHRFLSVLVDEFHRNNKRGPQCRSPVTTDQWTMNHLYYKGRFGFIQQTKTLPWGTGPVLTVGKPCASGGKNSMQDWVVFGEENGLILNPHEKDDSPARVAPTLHQWDRCRIWINKWFASHSELWNEEESYQFGKTLEDTNKTM